jgi:hypothetical protein
VQRLKWPQWALEGQGRVFRVMGFPRGTMERNMNVGASYWASIDATAAASYGLLVDAT